MPIKSKARTIAFGILKTFFEEAIPLSHLLDRISETNIDRREFSLAYEIIMGVIRWLRKIDYIISHFSKRPMQSLDIPIKTALRMGVYQMIFLERIPHSAAVDESVELVKKEKGLSGASYVNGVLRRISRDRANIQFPRREDDLKHWLSITYSHPEWMVARLLQEFGEDETEKIIDANNRHAQTSIWINRKLFPGENVLQVMKEKGVEVVPSRYLNGAFRVKRGLAQRTNIFERGGYYIQDEASQMVSLMFGSDLAGQALDLCTAPGGKGLKLAQLMGPRGFVIGIDSSHARLLFLKQNIERMRIDNLLPLNADGEKCLPLNIQFDYVLVDAPCSGMGVIRRNPDIKWRLQEGDMHSLSVRQAKILEKAKITVKMGGMLIYSVCSIDDAETVSVVASFIQRNPEFSLEDPSPRLPHRARQFVDEARCFRTFPHRDDLDGFFSVLLRRSA